MQAGRYAARVLALAVATFGCGPRLPGGLDDTTAVTSDTRNDVDVGESESESETGEVPVPEVVQLAAGGSHACGLWASLGVHCWGGGWLGQLGTGEFDDASTPQPVVGPDLDVSHIRAGQFHTCARLDSGEAVCWGHGFDGSLGNGSSDDSPQPVFVLGLSGPVTEAGGGPAQHHSCARLVDSTMMCWGHNDHGQLGDGTTEAASTAQPVIGLSDVRDFAIGHIHTCAVDVVGQVYCWGWNPHGLVDVAQPTEIDVYSPWPKVGLADVVALSAGNHHACALHHDGRVSCWGYEGHGQLGDGSELEHGEPLPVAGLDDAIAIAGGTTHECALRAGGSIVCWGANYSGQLGDGSTDSSPTPVEVIGIDDATQVTAGEAFTCAFSESRGPLCWGANHYGQLGDGTIEDSLTPVAVSPP